MSEERVEDRIDEAVLALLWLGIFQRYPMGGARTWKSFDWNAMERLHGKDLISDPVGKAKSVILAGVAGFASGRASERVRISRSCHAGTPACATAFCGYLSRPRGKWLDRGRFGATCPDTRVRAEYGESLWRNARPTLTSPRLAPWPVLFSRPTTARLSVPRT